MSEAMYAYTCMQSDPYFQLSVWPMRNDEVKDKFKDFQGEDGNLDHVQSSVSYRNTTGHDVSIADGFHLAK